MHAMRTTRMTEAQVCNPQTDPEKLAVAELCRQKADYQDKKDHITYGETLTELRELRVRIHLHVLHGTPFNQRTLSLLHRHEPSLLNQWAYNRARAERRARRRPPQRHPRPVRPHRRDT